MAILRYIDKENGIVVKVNSVEDEDKFMELNSSSGIFVKVDDSLVPDSISGWYVINPDDGSVSIYEPKELEAKKEKIINNLAQQVQYWILSQYPLEKQQADNHQAEYYGTAIILIRKQLIASGLDLEELTTTKIYDIVAQIVNQVKDGLTTLTDAVSNFPEQEQFYWEQVIKAGIRKAWTVWCSQIYSLKKQEILNASSLDELEEIQTLELPELETFLR